MKDVQKLAQFVSDTVPMVDFVVSKDKLIKRIVDLQEDPDRTITVEWQLSFYVSATVTFSLDREVTVGWSASPRDTKTALSCVMLYQKVTEWAVMLESWLAKK